MKDIKDYIHFHIGGKCMYKRSDWKDWFGPEVINHGMLIELVGGALEIKPILRPVSDMSEEEKHTLFTIMYGTINAFCAVRLRFDVKLDSLSVECFPYMLSRHFDIFGLIPAGLAIDKTKM